MHTESTDNQKVTAYIPKTLLRAAQDATGQGISETLRLGLEQIARKKAYSQLLALRGSYTPSVSLEVLRDDR